MWQIPKDEIWKEQARCRGEGPDLFFQERGAAVYGGYNDHPAKALCSTCPVRLECIMLWKSLSGMQQRYGVWGGLSSRQLRNRKLREDVIARLVAERETAPDQAAS